MPLLSAWLRRADPGAEALVLPGQSLRYGELLARPGLGGLQVLEGDAGALALGLVDAALGSGSAFPLPPGLPDDQRGRLLELAAAAAEPRLALIIATSGSEGAPKGVRLPWRAVAAASRMSARSLRFGTGDAWLACLPLHHVGGAMIVYRSLRAGATAVIHDGFDADAVAREFVRRSVTHISLVPPMLARLLEAGVAPPPSLRCALVGGAALALPLFRRAVAAGWPVCPTYGMTETCAQATVLWRPAADGWQEGDVGAPLPGARVAADADGVLRIATPARMAGYLGETGRAPAWIATRDLGRVDAAGHVYVTGRADDMLVSAGVNVHPLDVESRLAACPGVREAGVIGLRDLVWGDVIAAAYEGAIAENELDGWCRVHLPGARRPRRFLRVAALPRTASGKLDRRALGDLWREGGQADPAAAGRARP